MDIGRRELLTGVAATATAGLLPTVPAPATAAAALVPSLSARAITVAIGAPFRFAVPRKMSSLTYAFCDPWRVDFADGEPYRVIHEASGAVFPTDRFDELYDRRRVVFNAIWRDYAPPYPLTASHFNPRELEQTLHDVPAPAFNRAMIDGDSEDLAQMCRAARVVAGWCEQQARPGNLNRTILMRPTATIYKLRFKDIEV
jgi:hypothetical protein